MLTNLHKKIDKMKEPKRFYVVAGLLLPILLLPVEIMFLSNYPTVGGLLMLVSWVWGVVLLLSRVEYMTNKKRL